MASGLAMTAQKGPVFSLMEPEAVNFDATWSLLESSLLRILKDVGAGFPNDLWMTLYTGVYKLCTKPMGQQQNFQLYTRLKDMLICYVEEVLQDLRDYSESASHGGIGLLVRYRDAFENYNAGMKYGSELFKYLDRNWINTNHCDTGKSPREGVYFVYEMALIVWKDIVFDAMAVKLRSNIIAVIGNARENGFTDLGDDGVVKSLLQTYETLGFEKRDRSHLFQRQLEDYLVANTTEYYSRQGACLLQYMSVAEYLERVEVYLAEEEGRCSGFVGTYTSRRMLVAAQEALIALHCKRLIEEAAVMLTCKPERTNDLRRLYTLISYISGTESHCGTICGTGPENEAMTKLEDVVRTHITEVGMKVVNEVQAHGGIETLDNDDASVGGKPRPSNVMTSDEVVNAMLQVYEHYKQLVVESFNDSLGFRAVLDDACKAFVNAVPRAPEWLARFGHSLLDKGLKESKVDESARYEALDRVAFLFAYITDKDIFQKFYAKLLSKRIIQLTSISDEAEERMLANLRKISGFEFTSKLQRMFVDKALSRELHTGFIQWKERVMARLHAGVLQSDSKGRGSVFTFTDDEEKASKMMEDMSMTLNIGPTVNAPPELGSSPPLSPMYFSPKGLSPRMNILPSFAWGKLFMQKHLRKGSTNSSDRAAIAGGHGGSNIHMGGGVSEDSDRLYHPSGGSLNDVTHRVSFPTFDAFTFVLTAGCWPLQSVSSTFTPPGPISDYVSSFLEFYNEAHSGRKLEWLYHLGHGEIVTHGLDRQYRIYSSTFQMGILHQFNSSERLMCSEIAKGITITEAELSRHLFPLVKAGILVIETDKEVSSCDDIEPGHVVMANRSFTSRRTRIKINIVDHSRQPQKEDVGPVEVIQDRKMSVQAAICRLMKARKEMDHKSLTKEVKEQLQHLFVPDNAFIKQSIEELISKDYIARKNGKDSYIYCA